MENPDGTALATLVIYYSPSDYLGKFVTRCHWVHRTGVITHDEEPMAVADTISGARAPIPEDMVRLNRSPHDPPHVVEVWI